MSSQLTHNQTYAYRLPPTLEEQARALANWHESGVFSDSDSGIGNSTYSLYFETDSQSNQLLDARSFTPFSRP